MAKPAVPPLRALPSIATSAVTKRSIGQLSRSASWRKKRNGPVLFSVALRMRGILREHVLPVGHPLVGPARVGEQAVDGAGALVAGIVGEEGGGLLRGGTSPMVSSVARRRKAASSISGAGFDAGLLELRADEAIDVVADAFAAADGTAIAGFAFWRARSWRFFQYASSAGFRRRSALSVAIARAAPR